MTIFQTQRCVRDTQINEYYFVIAVTAMIWHLSARILLGYRLISKTLELKKCLISQQI